MTAFDDFIATLAPLLDYRFDEDLGALINHGSFGNDWDLPIPTNNAAPDREQLGGDVEGSLANTFPAASGRGFGELRSMGDFSGVTAGSVIFVYKSSGFPASPTPGLAYIQSLTSTGFSAFKIETQDTSSIDFEIIGGTGIDWTFSETNAAFTDGEYHIFVCVQPADGGGPDLYFDAVLQGVASIGTGDEDRWFADITAGNKIGIGGSLVDTGLSTIFDFFGGTIDRIAITETVLTLAQIEEMLETYEIGAPGDFFDTLEALGPDHWWRMRATAAPIIDIGVSATNGDSIATGGDPLFRAPGPLITDPTAAAIYFDGQLDRFEIGVAGISGQLVADTIGTIGFFVSRDDDQTMIIYSQANDLATAVWRIGINESQQIELLVQSSTGNTVTLTSSVTVDNLDFFFITLTNDGSNYILYINCVPDLNATVVTAGTGAEGNWFDDVTATRTAISALANSTFITETNGRSSEIFIFPTVLTESQICALFDAALADGFGSSATAIGALVFEDVTFLNGARADIRLSNSLTTFNQMLQVNRSRFLGGLESVDAESVSLTGEARATIRGSTFDLGLTPTTGRAAVLATLADPTAGASVYGNLLVSDCTFNRMGHSSTEVHPAVFAEAGFGLTVEQSRFLDSFVAAIGWRADARRVAIRHNTIDGVTSGVAGIYCQTGLNTNIGNAWSIAKNIILNVALGNGIRLEGANSSAAQFARDIHLNGNNIRTVGAEGVYLTQVQDVSGYGNRLGGSMTEGFHIGLILGVVRLLRNFVEDNTLEGFVLDEAVNQLATLIIDRNTVDASLGGDGMLFDGINELIITNNKFLNLVNGLTLGNIGSSAKFFGNQFVSVQTPFAFVAATTQNGLEIGRNQMPSLSGQEDLTIAANIINVFAPYHTITSVGATDLNSIGGFNQAGFVVVLQQAAGSGLITAKDGVGDMNLAGDFIMGDKDQLWLSRNAAGTWDELSRSDN